MTYRSPLSALRSPLSALRSPLSARNSRLSVATATVFLFLSAACSTPQPTAADDEPTTEQTADAPEFGTDPVGTAKSWAHTIPDDTPEAIRERVDAWSDPLVLRVYRADDTYRAVVADSDTRDADAILLTMIPAGEAGDWQVESAEPTDATHAWPTN